MSCPYYSQSSLGLIVIRSDHAASLRQVTLLGLYVVPLRLSSVTRLGDAALLTRTQDLDELSILFTIVAGTHRDSLGSRSVLETSDAAWTVRPASTSQQRHPPRGRCVINAHTRFR